MCNKHEKLLTDFYFKNMKACSCTENYTSLDAKNKIDELKKHIKEDEAIAFGAFYKDELIGYIWSYVYKFREEERLYISEIYVQERWRSQSIGKQLLENAEKAAENLGLKSLFIHAEAKNIGALKLYEREGFDIERIQLRKTLK